MQRDRKARAVGACLVQVLERKRRLLKLVRVLVLARVLMSLSLRYQPVANDLGSAISLQESQLSTCNERDLNEFSGKSMLDKAETSKANYPPGQSDEWRILVYGCASFCLLLVLVIPFCHYPFPRPLIVIWTLPASSGLQSQLPSYPPRLPLVRLTQLSCK